MSCPPEESPGRTNRAPAKTCSRQSGRTFDVKSLQHHHRRRQLCRSVQTAGFTHFYAAGFVALLSGFLFLSLRVYLALPANGDKRHLQRAFTACSGYSCRLEDRIIYVARREGLYHPWPMIVGSLPSSFQMVHDEVYTTPCGEQLTIRGINIACQAALNNVLRPQLRQLQTFIQLYLNVKARICRHPILSASRLIRSVARSRTRCHRHQ